MAKKRPRFLAQCVMGMLLFYWKATAFRTTSVRHRLSSYCRTFSTNINSSSVTESMRQRAQDEMDLLRKHYADQTASPLLLSSSAQVQSFIEQHRINAFLFDCDGVLYRGVDLAPNARECVLNLLNANKQLFFVTNNAGSNRRQLRDKLATLLECEGLLVDEQMITSSYSCAQYLKEQLIDSDKQITSEPRVHVIGTEGLCEEIQSTGFHVSGGAAFDHEPSSMSRDDLAEFDFEEHLHPVDAVVVGLDTAFNYRKLCIANVLLQRNPEALLVATNQDAFDLVGADARHLPGNGALVRALEHASQRTSMNVGKPSKVLADLIQRQHYLDPKRTMMVGDRLDTDIRFGIEGGMVSALVLTGCTHSDTLIKLGRGTKEEPLPDIMMPHMGLLA